MAVVAMETFHAQKKKKRKERKKKKEKRSITDYTQYIELHLRGHFVHSHHQLFISAELLTKVGF